MVINIILNIIAISLDTGIIGVAVATSISYGLRLIAGVGLGLYFLEMPKGQVIRFIFRIITPIIYVFLLLGGISALGGLLNLDSGSIYTRTAIEGLVFIVGALPLIWILWQRAKEFGVTDILKDWKNRK